MFDGFALDMITVPGAPSPTVEPVEECGQGPAMGGRPRGFVKRTLPSRNSAGREVLSDASCCPMPLMRSHGSEQTQGGHEK
jgi:hypothetical protein